MLDFPAQLPENRTPRAVIFGAGHGSTYPGKDSSGYTGAADAIRAASQEDAGLVGHWDFDLGGPLFEGQPVCCTDIGNIDTRLHDNAGNRARIEAQTRSILALPAVPILLGGDDSLPIPFLAAFADQGPLWVLQIDAHIDWRDEVDGERYGYSSPMRRISEMPHVAGLVQVGLRAVGQRRQKRNRGCTNLWQPLCHSARGPRRRYLGRVEAYSTRRALRRHAGL